MRNGWSVAAAGWLGVGLVVIVVKLHARRGYRRELRDSVLTLLGLALALVLWPVAIVGPRIDRWWFKRKRARR